jgi:intracellular sulfur oxidation DsrE/DsrF family protein
MKTCLRILIVSMIALAAICLVYAGQTGNNERQTNQPLLHKEDKPMDAKMKVVFHLDWDKEERLLMALENTKNLFKEIPPQRCSVQMLANGKAVNLLRKDRAARYAPEMEELHKSGVRFKACRNAMAKNHVEKADLLAICDVVPAGILELINRQREGFSYIKP